MNEPQSEKALKDMWTLAGNNQEPLNNVRLTGTEPSLPSIYKTGILAQSTIAAAALSATELLICRNGKEQTVTVDIDDASASFRSESYLTVEGKTRSEMNNLEPENNLPIDSEATGRSVSHGSRCMVPSWNFSIWGNR